MLEKQETEEDDDDSVKTDRKNIIDHIDGDNKKMPLEVICI
jgi:hypothetical protein